MYNKFYLEGAETQRVIRFLQLFHPPQAITQKIYHVTQETFAFSALWQSCSDAGSLTTDIYVLNTTLKCF